MNDKIDTRGSLCPRYIGRWQTGKRQSKGSHLSSDVPVGNDTPTSGHLQNPRSRTMNDYLTDEVREMVEWEKRRAVVILECGDLMYADTHFLAKLIICGNEDEKEVAGSEWQRRVGKPFPYHPSYDDDVFPVGEPTMNKLHDEHRRQGVLSTHERSEG